MPLVEAVRVQSGQRLQTATNMTIHVSDEESGEAALWQQQFAG